MFQSSKIGNLLAAIGLIGGAAYAMKGGKNPQSIAMFAIGFAAGGYILGNATSKFFEPSM